MKAVATIAEYIAAAPTEAQSKLKQMHKAIKALVPKETEEKIAYGIPTFKYHGNLVHFGGYKTHIGFYPGPAAIKKFEKELKPYSTTKGTVQFPLDEPLPLALIADIVKFRIKAQEETAMMKKK